MSLFKVFSVALAITFSLSSGCGFRPLYGGHNNSTNIAHHFSFIKIAPIENRIGQQLRNILLDKLTPKGAPRNPAYQLIVTITEARSNSAILQNATSTFAKIRLRASYRLESLRSGHILKSGTNGSTAVFNIVESEYANVKAETDAKTRAVELLSESIRNHLAIFFKTQLD